MLSGRVRKSVWRSRGAFVKLELVADDEPVIYREEVVALLFAVNDLVEGIGQIAELLREDDDDGEDV